MKKLTLILALIGLTTFFAHAQWTMTSPAINITPVTTGFTDIVEHNGALYVSHVKGISKSTDGIHWVDVSNNLQNHFVLRLVADDSAIYAVTNEDGIFRSTDNGATWVAKNNGITGHAIRLFQHNGTLLASPGTGVYYSTDNAETWTFVDIPSNNPIVSFAQHNGILFAGESEYDDDPKYLYKSEDNGASWQTVGVCPISVTYMMSFNGKLIIGSGGHVFMSDDNGESWEALTDGLGNGFMLDLSVINNKLVAAGLYNMLFESDTENVNWENIAPNNASVHQKNKKTIWFNNKLLLLSDSGIWERDSEQLSVNDIHTDNQSVSSLSNYPNPFRSSTTISVTLAQTANISIDVYNIFGQKVEQVTQQKLNAGTHNIEWHNTLSAGAYFLTLHVDGKKVNTTKCMVQ